MTKCLSLDSNKSSVIPPLKQSGYNGAQLQFWPASESRSQGQQMLHLHTCALKNQPTVRMAERTHMSWWLISLFLWMPFIGITKICWNVFHALPVQWAHQVKNKLRVLALWYFPTNNRAEWEQDEGLRKQTDPGRKHTPTAFLLALPGCSINSAATASTQHTKHSKCLRLSVAGLILIWSSWLWI